MKNTVYKIILPPNGQPNLITVDNSAEHVRVFVSAFCEPVIIPAGGAISIIIEPHKEGTRLSIERPE